MLAAAADRNSALGLFQLVLRSVETNPAVQISDNLKRHVVEILRTAMEIAADPRKIGAILRLKRLSLLFACGVTPRLRTASRVFGLSTISAWSPLATS
jgi:hypothetical protein